MSALIRWKAGTSMVTSLLRRLRIALWGTVALAILAGGAWLLLRPAPQPAAASEQWKARIGGRFTLVGSDGKPFDSARLNGTPFAIFFGFTNCPDVCPTTLARLVRLREQLGTVDKLAIVFVTVDPERDGPVEIGRYAQLFAGPVIGLTGSVEQIERVKKQFGVFSARNPGESGGYSVDHTATVFLFDRGGHFQSTIAPDEADPSALDKLKRLSDNS